MAGTAQPLTGSGCYGGTTVIQDHGQECTKVVGSGLKITSIAGEYNNSSVEVWTQSLTLSARVKF